MKFLKYVLLLLLFSLTTSSEAQTSTYHFPTFADLDAYPKVRLTPGQLATATDQNGKLYRFDGTIWNAIGESGFKIMHNIYRNNFIGNMRNAGATASPNVRDFFSYTPNSTGEIKVIYYGDVLIGSMGLRVGTTLGGNENHLTPLSDRLTPSVDSAEYIFEAQENVQYFFQLFAGGNSTVSNSGASIWFEDSGDVMLEPIQSQSYSVDVESVLARVGVYRETPAVDINATSFTVNVDFSNSDILEIVTKDNSTAARSWGIQRVDIKELISHRSAFVHIHNDDYLILELENIDDEKIGKIKITDNGREQELIGINVLEYVPTGDGKKRIGKYDADLDLATASTRVTTNIDFNTVDVLEFIVRDNAGVDRVWANTEIDMVEFLVTQSAFIHVFDNSYCIVDLVDATTGEIDIRYVNRATHLKTINAFVYGDNAGSANVSGIPTSRLSAELGAVDIPLPAATGSEQTVIFVLSNKDNAVTISPMAGEKINNVVDYVFPVSDYEVGTQFLLTDNSTGSWTIADLGGGELGTVETRDLIFDEAIVNTNVSQNLDNGLTWQQVKDTYEYLVISYIGNGYSNTKIFETSNIFDGAIFPFLHGINDHFHISSVNLFNGEFLPQSIGNSYNFSDFKIYGVKSQTSEFGDIGKYRFTATTDNASGQPSGNGLFRIETGTETINVGGIASYDSATGRLTITSGDNPVDVKANFFTTGTGVLTSFYYFRDIADATGIVLGTGTNQNVISTRGVFGQGSSNRYATASIPANTNITIDVRSNNSANNQSLQTGSYIEVQEVIAQKTVINSDNVTITNSIVNGIRIREFSDGYIKMWGTDTSGGLNSRTITFPNGITMSDTMYDVDVEIQSSNVNRFVQVGTRGTTSFVIKPHNTGSNVIWSIEGYRQ